MGTNPGDHPVGCKTPALPPPPPAIYTALRSAPDFPGGVTYGLLCQAIATSLVAWLPTGVLLRGVTTGVLGAGVVSGSLAFAPNPSTVVSALTGSLAGPVAPRLARALLTALPPALTPLPYAGVSVGVASGTDLSAVSTVNVPALTALLRDTHVGLCGGLGGSGSLSPALYTGLSLAIAAIVTTGATVPGTGVVVPSGSPAPGSGVGTSTSSPT